MSPKSVVTDGQGNFSVQNMMYRHTIVFYNSNGELRYTLSDGIKLSDFGHTNYDGDHYDGAPVEAVFTKSGEFIYVSNYNMEGKGFNKPGCDGCVGTAYDPGFIYKIHCDSNKIVAAIEVGAVPKYLALSNDDKILIASNWTSSDISIVDTKQGKEIKKVNVGSHPRGVVIDSKKENAYVTIMGSNKIAKVNLLDYSVSYIKSIGSSPRHLCLTESDSILYIAVNSSNTVVKYNLFTEEKVICKTNSGPRSMILSPDESFIYVVNYFANTFSKIQTDSMKVVEVQKTKNHPIGIAANWRTGEIWVACYVGIIEIYKDFELLKKDRSNSLLEEVLALLPEFKGKKLGNESTLTNAEVQVFDSSLLAVSERAKVQEVDEKKIEQPKETVKEIEKAAEIIEPKPKKVIKSSEKCVYHIIVGSFSVPDNAEKRGKEIASKGYEIALISGKSGMTYVSAECFSSKEQASSNLSDVEKTTGIGGWVLKY